ncbi:MAG TPA: alkaline phosphatase family protein [Candidatus Baltobacteraceae bacterium]|nr:alkaline phosphatase family protein [Candidatus Baltobacteraceae bacterium]
MRFRPLAVALILTLAGAAGCSPHAAGPIAEEGFLPGGRATAGSQGKIQHIVIVVQENRSFDNLFAKFPGAEGARYGKMHDGRTIPLRKSDLTIKTDLCHEYHCFRVEWDGGAMDGFDVAWYGTSTPSLLGTYAYQYVDPAQIQPYWAMAEQYVLGDHMFQTQGAGSFTSHQDLIAGDTSLDAGESVIDAPWTGLPWGCDAPAGTSSPILTRYGTYEAVGGPFPCYTYPTIRDRLDAAKISWKYYTPSMKKSGKVWNAFDAIKAVRYSSEWTTNVVSPETKIFHDISGGTLPAVSWVIPQFLNSDHPGAKDKNGPSWVASIVNAIGQSSAWSSTAIVIVWDDWGGLYDNVPPPQITYDNLGFRVPMIVVSPYARRGYVSHTQYEFASILKFIEENWNLPSLKRADVRANSIGDVFNFSQAARKFTVIPALHSVEYFLRQKPSELPVDTE